MERLALVVVYTEARRSTRTSRRAKPFPPIGDLLARKLGDCYGATPLRYNASPSRRKNGLGDIVVPATRALSALLRSVVSVTD